MSLSNSSINKVDVVFRALFKICTRTHRRRYCGRTNRRTTGLAIDAKTVTIESTLAYNRLKSTAYIHLNMPPCCHSYCTTMHSPVSWPRSAAACYLVGQVVRQRFARNGTNGNAGTGTFKQSCFTFTSKWSTNTDLLNTVLSLPIVCMRPFTWLQRL